MKRALAPCILALCTSPALADMRVEFDEGAPVDRFTITNAGACTLSGATVTIDLVESAGRLIFDVTESGAGIEVFQPFRVVAGGDLLTKLPTVSDGDTTVSLGLRSLGPNERVAFTIDVDDTTSGYGIMVSGSEITGAMVRIEADESRAEGRFGTDSTARIALASCTS